GGLFILAHQAAILRDIGTKNRRQSARHPWRGPGGRLVARSHGNRSLGSCRSPPGRAGDAGGQLCAAIALDDSGPADHLEAGPFDERQLGWNNLNQKTLHASRPPAATVGAAVSEGQRLPAWQTFFASHIQSEIDARAAH